MKTIVYSCIVGGYDDLKLFDKSVFNGLEADYVLFTDQFTYIDGWETKPILTRERDDIRTSRWHKINSHLVFPDAYDTIWIDGNQIPHGTAKDILASWPLGTFKHPKRDCIYDEAQCCIDMNKDCREVVQRQSNFYKSMRYPVNNGLVETCCIYRANSLHNARLNDLWWRQLKQFSHRDQISFNYVIWKLDTEYNIIPGCRIDSNFLKYADHVKPTF